MSLPAPRDLAKDIPVRMHTHQYKPATPVPESTPPEHKPNTEDKPGAWDHLKVRADGWIAVSTRRQLLVQAAAQH